MLFWACNLCQKNGFSLHFKRKIPAEFAHAFPLWKWHAFCFPTVWILGPLALCFIFLLQVYLGNFKFAATIHACSLRQTPKLLLVEIRLSKAQFGWTWILSIDYIELQPTVMDTSTTNWVCLSLILAPTIPYPPTCWLHDGLPEKEISACMNCWNQWGFDKKKEMVLSTSCGTYQIYWDTRLVVRNMLGPKVLTETLGMWLAGSSSFSSLGWDCWSQRYDHFSEHQKLPDQSSECSSVPTPSGRNDVSSSNELDGSGVISRILWCQENRSQVDSQTSFSRQPTHSTSTNLFWKPSYAVFGSLLSLKYIQLHN